MKLSIIIPVYNGSMYLNECIKSIVQQEYGNLQIICIDDGSNDGSLDILKDWQEIDPRIEVYSQLNQGVSCARNKGIEYAKGDFITFVDCDDTLELDMYKKLMYEFRDKSVDIVHCTYNRIAFSGDKYTVGGYGKKYIETGDELCELLVRGKRITGSLWNKIYRIKSIKDLRFDESLKVNEDILFNYYAMRGARKTIYIDLGLYNYYERKTSACINTNKIKQVDDCVQVANIIYQNEYKSNLRQFARNKYYFCLCNQLRVYIYSNLDTAICKKNIDNLIGEGILISKKYLYNYWIMKKFPNVYKKIYTIYDQIRKPNWDV